MRSGTAGQLLEETRKHTVKGEFVVLLGPETG
jgi:hypothetical protein